MKKESKQDRTYAQAIALIEELAILAYARAHGTSLSTAQAHLTTLANSGDRVDAAAYDAALVSGEGLLAGELGLHPAALRAWLDDEQAVVFPTLKRLTALRQGLQAAA